MPKKHSSWGQQEYVPAGNGDASGEYADEGGSNKHFTSFQKPQEDNTENSTFKSFKKVETETKIEEKPIEKDIKTVRKETRGDLIKKCVNPSRENDITFEEVVDESNDESIGILNQYLKENQKLTIKFGGAGRNAAGYASGYGEIVTNHSVHTIRHELGHTFDNWYGKDMEKAEGKFAFESQDYASVRYVDNETGLTMNETLHKELGVSMSKATIKGWKISYKKEFRDKTEVKAASFKRINDIYNKYGDKIFDEMTGIPNSRKKYKEFRERYNDINWNMNSYLADTPEYKEYQRLKSEVYKAENEYRDEMVKKGAWSINFDNSPKVRAARQTAELARQGYEKLKNQTFIEKFGEKDYEEYQKIAKLQYSVYKKMEGVAGLVGDTSDYLNVGTTFYASNGHGKNYFDKRKESGYVLEIFANMFDCYMSKDSWKRDCVREMFPETSKIFEKIYYKKGKKL